MLGPEVRQVAAYLRDRLTIMRDLLTESGSIFVQIGDTLFSSGIEFDVIVGIKPEHIF